MYVSVFKVYPKGWDPFRVVSRRVLFNWWDKHSTNT